jgi:hypothetical protein
MLPIPWQIGLFGAALALLAGLFLGLSPGILFSSALRRRRRCALDGIAGAAGFLAGSCLSAVSRNFAVELNGAVVGWQPGIRWPRLRAWAPEHGLLAAIIGCVVCLVLGRVFAGAAAHLLALRAGRHAKI